MQRRPSTRGGGPPDGAGAVAAATPTAVEAASSDLAVTVDLEASVPGEYLTFGEQRGRFMHNGGIVSR